MAPVLRDARHAANRAISSSNAVDTPVPARSIAFQAKPSKTSPNRIRPVTPQARALAKPMSKSLTQH